jgi:membrane protease YdiL (CAAX protease family)
MFTAFCRSWTASIAGFVVTALFVASHIPETRYLPALVSISVLGGAALIFRIQTKSLAPAIALHASYNLAVVVATYLRISAIHWGGNDGPPKASRRVDPKLYRR